LRSDDELVRLLVEDGRTEGAARHIVRVLRGAPEEPVVPPLDDGSER
jgi:hypothetical protein